MPCVHAVTWIRTRTGKKFDLLNPRAEDVCIEDISYALSNICRFTGHCEFYSVAQHSLVVQDELYYEASKEDQLFALLHDAHEAYVGDISTPLKALLPDYQVLEARVAAVVREAFGLPSEMPAVVKDADRRLLETEAIRFMGGPFDTNIKPFPCLIVPWDPDVAQNVFMDAWSWLGRGYP